MAIRWTRIAREHVQPIHAYISLDSPTKADKVIDRIVQAVNDLLSQPYFGWLSDEYGDNGLREIVVCNFRVFQKIIQDEIVVLAIYRGARRLPDSLQEN